MLGESARAGCGSGHSGPEGQRSEPVEMLVNTGATFTKAPRELLEWLGVSAESTYTTELADGSRIE